MDLIKELKSHRDIVHKLQLYITKHFTNSELKEITELRSIDLKYLVSLYDKVLEDTNAFILPKSILKDLDIPNTSKEDATNTFEQDLYQPFRKLCERKENAFSSYFAKQGFSYTFVPVRTKIKGIRDTHWQLMPVALTNLFEPMRKTDIKDRLSPETFFSTRDSFNIPEQDSSYHPIESGGQNNEIGLKPDGELKDKAEKNYHFNISDPVRNKTQRQTRNNGWRKFILSSKVNNLASFGVWTQCLSLLFLISPVILISFREVNWLFWLGILILSALTLDCLFFKYIFSFLNAWRYGASLTPEFSKKADHKSKNVFLIRNYIKSRERFPIKKRLFKRLKLSLHGYVKFCDKCGHPHTMKITRQRFLKPSTFVAKCTNIPDHTEIFTPFD